MVKIQLMAALFLLCLWESLRHAKHVGFSVGQAGLLITFRGGDYRCGSPVPQHLEIVLCKPQGLGMTCHLVPIFLSAYIKVSAPDLPTILPSFNSVITSNQTSGLRGKWRQAASNTARKFNLATRPRNLLRWGRQHRSTRAQICRPRARFAHTSTPLLLQPSSSPLHGSPGTISHGIT